MSEAPQAGSHYENQAFDQLDLSRADLTDCVFDACSFIGTNFRAADLSRSFFKHCQFNDSSSDAPADFSQAKLREARFEQCNLTVVDFIRCAGYDLIFIRCQLQGADLSKSDFRMPIGNTELTALTMQDCNFAYGNLANTHLAECSFIDSRLSEACFDYCDLTNANLSGCEFNNISAVGLCLTGADLRGASFNNINPRELDLQGVRIYFSDLSALLAPLGVIVEDDPA